MKKTRGPIQVKHKEYTDINEWSHVTIQSPIFNEGILIENLMQNLSSLDYPKNRLQIQILDDSTDKLTLKMETDLAQKYQAMGFDVQILHRDDRTGYKAGALNNGLKTAKGEFIAVVDADTVLPEGFLKDLIPAFYEDENLAFVQAKCEYTDRWFNWVTESNAIIRDVHYLIEQPTRSWYNLLPNFSGKAGVWRKTVLEKYGWDEESLTEDIEISYRVQLDGWKSLYHLNPICLIELPPNLIQLKTQQKRWTAGFAQSFKKLWKKIVTSKKLSLVQKCESLLHLSSSLTHVITLLAISFWTLAAIFEPELTLNLWFEMKIASLLMLFLSAGPILSTVVAILVSTRKEKIIRKICTIPLTLTLLTVNLFANAQGAILGFLRNDLAFERTIKYGITKNTKKREIKGVYRLTYLLKRNALELTSSILITIALILVLLKGQITSAIPLIFLLFSWLISAFHR